MDRGFIVAAMALKYVVVTSVDRDDLRDGGAGHFAACVASLRQRCPDTRVEILVPDFWGKGRMERALEILHSELTIAMEFAGTPTIDSIGPDAIGRA